ncbi:MAG TPA: hypothetical protein VFU31_00575 [Candidatus Binatia bacterium]|nr:hypothetical protein [Candidatus Binatia bacterium]
MRYLPILLLLTGCAGFGTTQTDRSYDPDTGKLIREVRTRAASRTFFESNSKLAIWEASQTDSSQRAKVGGLNQSASATNLVNLVEIGVDGVIRYFAPVPLK